MFFFEKKFVLNASGFFLCDIFLSCRRSPSKRLNPALARALTPKTLEQGQEQEHD